MEIQKEFRNQSKLSKFEDQQLCLKIAIDIAGESRVNNLHQQNIS